MKVVQVNSTKEKFPLNFPQSIKGDKLEYFKRGQGYKKTKSFTILSDELPERCTELSWFQVAEMADKYGLNIGEMYAECKTAGIIARQTISGYLMVYQKIKNLIPENFDHSFFELLKCDYMLSCFGVFVLDIVSLDNKLSEIDTDYNNKECTYKGKKCSMREYISIKYGKEYAMIIEAV